MRSYSQYCAIAKSLDVLGDRWTLLIVRELLLNGSLRYTDLRTALPGIATNLLADRLRELEGAGVLQREEAPPPVATTLYSLTERGLELRPVLDALGRWGVPLMAAGPAAEDVFRGEWIAWPAETFLADARPGDPPATIEIRTEGRPFMLEAAEGSVRARPPRPGEQADATIEGSPHAIVGLLSGNLDLDGAAGHGVAYGGDRTALERLRPAAPAASSH